MSEILFKEAAKLLERLQDEEYLYLLLEPIPFYGLIFALLLVFLSVVFRDKKIKKAAMLLLVIASLSAWPTQQMREKSLHQVTSVREEAYREPLKDLSQLYRKMIPANFTIGGAAFLMLALGAHSGIGMFVRMVSWPILLAGLGLLMWMHFKSTEVVHPNLQKSYPILNIPNPSR